MAPTAMATGLALLALTALAPPCNAAGALQGASAEAVSISSVQKVIQMLNDMSAKSKKEKQEEQVAFAKFSTWCTQEVPRLQGEITKNGEQMQSLGARIQKLGSDVTTLGQDVAELNRKAATAEADLKAETEQRSTDHAAFVAESEDYQESIHALERAIAVLQKQAYDRTGSQSALLQLQNEDALPAKAKTAISAFVDVMNLAKRKEDPDFMSYEAPEANAYEFQSSGIVDLLKRLMTDFKAKLAESQKEEMNSKHAHEMVAMDLTDTLENAKRHADEKTAERLRKAESAARDKKELAATSAVKAENEKTLQAATTDCSENKVSFEEKQRLRAEEIEAIAKAVEILSSPEVAGAAETHLSLAQLRPSGPAITSALVQLAGAQGNAGGSEGIKRRLREFLASEGRRLHSQRLGLLAQQLASDPFVKVKKMIEGLITRLQEEAHGDAEHEGFCDKELGKSQITRSELTGEIDRLSAAIDDGKATISALTQSMAVLSREVAGLTEAMAEATALRQEESKANAAALKDAQAAQVAVEAATAVLKKFYDMASSSSVQQVQQQDAATGVLGLLEVIQSDFANLEANTRASETEGQKTYEIFMAESRRSKAVKERKVELNTADKASAESKLQADTADLKATQDQMLAAERYYEKLKPQCIDSGMTYEERRKARAEEIASLRQALEILSSGDVATSTF